MLDQVTGSLVTIETNYITIEVNGLGLKLSLPTSDIAQLPSIGEQATLYTALFFKEPQFELFGFLSQTSRELFYELTHISGIGPKTALHVLSAMRIEDLYRSIHKEDASMIAKVPGIGKKTAQRLILEMKSKIPSLTVKTSNLDDALLALQNLGFNELKAKHALEKVYKENQKAKTDELITQSLKHLS